MYGCSRHDPPVRSVLQKARLTTKMQWIIVEVLKIAYRSKIYFYFLMLSSGYNITLKLEAFSKKEIKQDGQYKSEAMKVQHQHYLLKIATIYDILSVAFVRTDVEQLGYGTETGRLHHEKFPWIPTMSLKKTHYFRLRLSEIITYSFYQWCLWLLDQQKLGEQHLCKVPNKPSIYTKHRQTV